MSDYRRLDILAARVGHDSVRHSTQCQLRGDSQMESIPLLPLAGKTLSCEEIPNIFHTHMIDHKTLVHGFRVPTGGHVADTSQSNKKNNVMSTETLRRNQFL